ncbi:MAG: C1 family peptidase [Muribaculaceae bacterium]|nr:C1 family peptidase [Muribaculaceae bacterium]
MLSASMITTVANAADKEGGLTPDVLSKVSSSYNNSAAARAIHNAISSTDITTLAANQDAKNGNDTYFSHRVPSKGITDQKRSGRCWLFTGLNVIRSKAMLEHKLPQITFSQSYNFFYDQLEKANLFLQGVIETGDKPIDDRLVQVLFKSPVSDGGQYTGIADNLMKYGIVPTEVMAETFSTDNTSKLRELLNLKLREFGLELRDMVAAKSKSKDIQARKVVMLSDVYRMLALAIGVPPQKFTWTRKDAAGNPIETKEYTPQSFYAEFVGDDLKNNYVMLMNDPTREYYKLYEIDYDRHTYDGENWTYINLPMDEIKKIAINSIKDSTAMYFSCDVNKFIDRKRGVLDINNYDYGSLFGVTFDMDKKQRIITGASASSHAMTLVAVDLDSNDTPKKWMVENSWGNGANNGHLIITDEWFDNYMFRLVANKKYVSDEVLKILKQKPTMLPAWDPMFADEQ